MKKNKIYSVLLLVFLFNVNSYASEASLKNLSVSNSINDIISVDDTTACCTRTSSSGNPGTSSFISVSVTKCYGGKTHNDAYVAACHNASLAAENVVKALKETTVTIFPTIGN